MKNNRRILGLAAGLVAVAAPAFCAPIITFGTDPITGNYTVTQTVTLGAVNLNVASPTSLFTFGSFASLGLGSAQYVNGDSTFDYEFTNTVTTFQVTNNDTSSDTINAAVNSQLNVDPNSTMACSGTGNVCPPASGSSSFHQTSDAKAAGVDLGFGFGTVAGTPNVPLQMTQQLASTPGGGVTLTSGQTYTYPGLPITWTDGIGFSLCSTFGNTGADSGCNLNIGNSEAATGFSYGLTDTQQFGESLVGTGILNLNIQATTMYQAEAEVTYEYTVPQTNGTPEPTTMLLFGSGLVALGLLRRKIRS